MDQIIFYWNLLNTQTSRLHSTVKIAYTLVKDLLNPRSETYKLLLGVNIATFQ